MRSTVVCPNCGDDLVVEAAWRRCKRCGGRWTDDGQPYVPPSWVACPDCGEGWVKPHHIRSVEIVWLCVECDSVWLSEESIGPTTSQYLGDVVARGDEVEPVEDHAP